MADGSKDSGAALLESIKKFVIRRNFEELEAVWMIALEDPQITNGDLMATLHALARRGDATQVSSLFWFLLSDRFQKRGGAEALTLAREAAGLPPSKPADAFLPDSESLRNELATLYREKKSNVADIGMLVEMTLLRPAIPLVRGMEALEKLISLAPETYVLDRKDAGRVTGVDAGRKALAVEFADGTRCFEATDLDRLTPLETNDFRARLVFDRDGLKKLAQNDPAEIVTLVLRAQGPFLPFREMKAVLSAVISGSAWAKWWTMARPILKRAPLVQMSEDSQPSFGLRAKPVAYDDDVRGQFNSASTADDKLAVVLDYIRDTSGENPAHPPNAELLKTFAAQVGKMAREKASADPMGATAALAVVSEMHALHPQSAEEAASPEPMLFQGDKPAVMQAVVNERVAQCALRFVRRMIPERWHQVYTAVLPVSTQEMCDWIAAELAEAGFAVDIAAVVPVILSRPDRNANALIWLWRTPKDKFGEALASTDRMAVASRLLSAAEMLAKKSTSSKSEQKQMQTAVIRALQGKDHDLFRQALEGARSEQLKVFRTSVERNIALTDHTKNQLIDVIRHVHPAMFETAVEIWDQDVIYVTEDGLKRRQEELYELVNVKLAAASKAVGLAAADGDLSENFAWTAALAERDRLAGTATRMQAEIAKARPITNELCANTEHVTIGSAVRAKNPAGAEKIFTFLGQWDADHDKGIFAYSATMGHAFMGKKVGDAVSYEMDGMKETWEILEIKPGVS